jgi:hypothetical protein
VYLDDNPFNLPSDENAVPAAFTARLAASKDPGSSSTANKDVRYDSIVQVRQYYGRSQSAQDHHARHERQGREKVGSRRVAAFARP